MEMLKYWQGHGTKTEKPACKGSHWPHQGQLKLIKINNGTNGLKSLTKTVPEPTGIK